MWVCVNNGVLRNTVYTRYRYILLLLLLSDQQKGTQSFVLVHNITIYMTGLPKYYRTSYIRNKQQCLYYYIAVAGIILCAAAVSYNFIFFPITRKKNPSVHSKRKRFVCKCTYTHRHIPIHYLCV